MSGNPHHNVIDMPKSRNTNMENVWICGNCKNHSFHLLCDSGEVICSHCGAISPNIAVFQIEHSA